MKFNEASYLLTLIIMSLLIGSCQNRPKEVLNRKKMELLMYDVYVAEAIMENNHNTFNSNEKKEAYINKVFVAHGISQARWDTSLSWYSDRIDIYLQMNDSVKARLQRDKDVVDARIARENMQDVYDPTEVLASYIPPYYSFISPYARSGFSFIYDSTEIATDIIPDTFNFSFNAIGIPPALDSILSLSVILSYMDTTIYHFSRIQENTRYSIPVWKYIDDDTLTLLRGFIHLQRPLGYTPNIQLYNIYLGGERPDSAVVSMPNDSIRALDSLEQQSSDIITPIRAQ